MRGSVAIMTQLMQMTLVKLKTLECGNCKRVEAEREGFLSWAGKKISIMVYPILLSMRLMGLL